MHGNGNGNGISWRSLKSQSGTTDYEGKKSTHHFAVWTSECSCRASVAPAGWTSSGLRAPHTGGWTGGPDSTCRGYWLIPLHIDSQSCHPLRLPMLIFVVPGRRLPQSCAHHPCAGAGLILIVRQIILDLRAAIVHEGLHSRQTKGHLRSRIIPVDDTHEHPLLEELIQTLQTQESPRL